MLSLQTDKIGNLSIVECQGSIARTAEIAQLRAAVLARDWAEAIIIDLSEVRYLEMDAIQLLAFLRSWARENGIQLKLFNPSSYVRHQFKTVDAMFHFEFASLPDAMGMLIRAESDLGAQAMQAELSHAA